jgi:hypothetical protein
MTHTISTKPFPGRTVAWDVKVDGHVEGVVRARKDNPEQFVGICHGKVYGPFDSKVEAVDAVAKASGRLPA